MPEPSPDESSRSTRATAGPPAGQASGAVVTGAADEQLRRANRALGTLTACNRAINRATDELELLQSVCAVLANGGYRLAWVGIPRADPEQTVAPVASAGPGVSYLDDLRVGWGDGDAGQGPAGRCIRSGAPVVVTDLAREASFAPWRDAALANGFAACAALPLRLDDSSPPAVLALYAPEPDAFDADEIRLLVDLADDLSFGVRATRERLGRLRTEQELLKKSAELSQLLEASPTVIYSIDVGSEESRPVEVSANILRVTGFTRTEALTPGWWITHLHPDDRVTAIKRVAELTAKGEVAHDIRVRHRDGGYRWIHDELRLIRDDEGNPVKAVGAWTDVTELKEAELALTQEASKLADAQRIANLGSWELELPSGRVTWSDETYVIFGLDRGTFDCTLDAWLELVEPEDRLVVRFWFDNLAAGRPTGRIEFRTLWAGVDIRWVAGTGALVQYGEYGPMRAQGTVQDVTEQNRATQLLQLQSRRAEALLALPRIAEEHDEVTFMQRALELAEDLTGSQIGFVHLVADDEKSIELVAWSRRTLNHYCTASFERHQPLEQAGIWADALRTRRAVLFNDYASYPDKRGLPEGHAALDRLITVPVMEGGKVALLAGIGNAERPYTTTDVETVQLIANSAWRMIRNRRSDERLRKLSSAVEQSPASVVITNVDAEIEYVNEAFMRITGYTEDDALGRNPRFLQSGRTTRETFQSMWQTLTQGRTWQGLLHNQRKDGSQFTEFAIITPIRQPDGGITHYVAVKEDVTEKQKIGEELDRHRHHLEELVAERTAELAKARRQADAANEAKSAFLANMSHEIRTPMNAIVGLTHLMQHESPTPQQSNRLEKIDGAARHLLALINDILDLSKIESGKLRLERTNFTLTSVLDNVRGLIAEPCSDKGLRIEVDTDGAPGWLYGDPTRLRQALLNYAGNAVKFTERGFVALRVRLLGESGDEIEMRFEVEDSGIGIAPEQQARLFEAFEQADPSITRKHGGTGLGLAITRRLAEAMGGRAGFHSTPGAGSTFWFTARLQRGRGEMPTVPIAPEVQRESNLRARCAGARVLVVEDNEINLEVTHELLRGLGFDVSLARNGVEAVAKASAERFDLVLMDVQMPEMDGLEATRVLRARAETAELPILAMTANAFAEDRDECAAAGMNDFVAKPVDTQALYRVLLRWLPPPPDGVSPAPVPRTAPPPVGPGGSERFIATLPGIEAQAAVKALGGNAERYVALLRRFVRSHAGDAADIRHLGADGRKGEARQKAHALHGAAATLGVTGVALPSRRLEAGLRQALPGFDLDELASEIEQQMTALAAALDAEAAERRAPAAAPALSDIDLVAAQSRVAELEQLLHQSDPRAIRFVAEHEAPLRAILNERLDRIVALLDEFSFDGALDHLRRRRDTAGPA